MQLFPNVGTVVIAALVQTELALSKLRLYKSPLTPSALTVLADLTALEADYTGYTAGGETITAFLNPVLSPAGGSSIDWPTEQFATVAPYTIGNTIYGWFLVSAAGDLIAAGSFNDPIDMSAADQGFAFPGGLVFPN